MKKPRPPRLVTIAVLTTVTIILWVFFGVYRILTSSPPTVVPEELLAPINATLDQEALGNIETRIFFTEDEIPENIEIIPVTEIPIETEDEAPTPSSPSAEITEEAGESLSPTPTATEAGTLET